jgi:DNA-binding MltR family transcriptional regulator
MSDATLKAGDPMTDEVPLRDSPEAKQAFNALCGSLSRESDRGLVLVGVSFLDAQLEALLRAKFSLESPKTQAAIDPLFDVFGPLASFSAKCRVAYALGLGLIDESTHRDLELLRKLRNRFAHTTEQAEFDAPDVVELTEKLEGADHAVRVLEKKRCSN